MTAHRLFTAIEIPQEIRRVIAERSQALRQSVPEARASWERFENIHLTLKFLGNVELTKHDVLKTACESAANRSHSFDLIFTKAGAFQKRRSLPILWLGVESTGNWLNNLAANLESECESAGFERESRPLSPHITIARVKSFSAADSLVQAHLNMHLEQQRIRIDQFVLIKSELSSTGSNYSVVSQFKLQD